MPILLNTRLVAFAPLIVLGACSSTPPGGWVAPASGYYQTLASNAAQTNDFGGVGIRGSTTNTDEFDVVSASGSIEHSTGSLVYNDGTHNLVDPDGFNGGVASDVSGGAISEATGLYAGTYEYVMPVTFSYISSGIAYTTQGFAGITTEAANIPITGSASYNGAATGIVNTTDFYNLADGVSAISVDFAAGSADVSLNGFTATDAFGAAATAPIDTIMITGMTINGSTFTGGALATLLGGATVNLTGTNTTISSQGRFFGWDSTADIPAEVAGVGVAGGDDGILLFSYIGN